MSDLDAAALTLVGLAGVTTVILFVLYRLRHRVGPQSCSETSPRRKGP